MEPKCLPQDVVTARCGKESFEAVPRGHRAVAQEVSAQVAAGSVSALDNSHEVGSLHAGTEGERCSACLPKAKRTDNRILQILPGRRTSSDASSVPPAARRPRYCHSVPAQLPTIA